MDAGKFEVGTVDGIRSMCDHKLDSSTETEDAEWHDTMAETRDHRWPLDNVGMRKIASSIAGLTIRQWPSSTGS